MSLALSILFLAVVTITAYVLVLRPVLRQRVWLRFFYDRLDGFWSFVWLYFKGLRTLLTARLQYIAGWTVVAHESIAVALQTYAPAIDWSPVTTLLLDRLQVPAEMRPLAVSVLAAALLAISGHVFAWLRKFTDGPVGHKGIGEPGA